VRSILTKDIAANRSVQEHKLKKKREFLEENRKLVQLEIDHPET
jgi:hypothetical protein